MKHSFEDEINNIIMDAFHESVISIRECGNHDLNRNYVFQVMTEQNRNLIIKFYYKANKRLREANALKHIEHSALRIERMGETFDGTEWSLYNYIKGEMLETLIPIFTDDDSKKIFFEIGWDMGMLHSSKQFDYFGDWLKEKQSPVEQYQSFIIKDTERIINNLRFLPEEDQSILAYAIKAVREEYEHIRVLKVGRLCHRDYDGRNIIIDQNSEGEYHLNGILDFEKCVVFNEHYDIVGLYRKYFLYKPELIKPFFDGYTQKMSIDSSFETEFRFNLFRMGLDLCSWSKRVSESFYDEVFQYLKYLIEIDGNFEKFLYE
jgi:serine/threonine protein kinase